MSSTTKDETPESSPSQSKLAIAQKKLKVLKQALKQERVDREKVEQELEIAKKNIEQLKNVISDKEAKHLQLYQENANLQEALLRESKTNSNPIPKKQTMPKPPLFVSSNSSSSQKSKQSESQSIQNLDQLDKNEAYEMLLNKCLAYEELIKKQDEDLKQKTQDIEQLTNQCKSIESFYQKQISQIDHDRNELEKTLDRLELEYTKKFEAKDLEVKELKAEHQKILDKMTVEHTEVVNQRNYEMDRNLKIGETIDLLNEKIVQLDKELQRRNDEINLRKEVIDSMSNSLMKHEKESGELASKLALMKNQIIESSIGSGIGKKFAAVKVGKLKQKPVALEFTEDKSGQYFLIIDCKDYEVSVEFESVENILGTKDGKIQMLYYVPQDNGSMQKRSEVYDLFETEEFLNVYLNIKTQVNLKDTTGLQKKRSFPNPSPSPSSAKNLLNKYF
eukprot:403352511